MRNVLQISRLGHSGNLSFELVVLFTELLTVLYRQCLQGVERNLGERDYEKLVLHAVNLENYTYQQVTVICHHCRGVILPSDKAIFSKEVPSTKLGNFCDFAVGLVCELSTGAGSACVCMSTCARV